MKLRRIKNIIVFTAKEQREQSLRRVIAFMIRLMQSNLSAFNFWVCKITPFQGYTKI